MGNLDIEIETITKEEPNEIDRNKIYDILDKKLHNQCINRLEAVKRITTTD